MNKLFLVCVCLWSAMAMSHPIDHYKPFYTCKDTFKPEKKHSAKKATIYSAVLPGLGQAYNHKYWKMPIIYAALGISGYNIIKNRKEMRGRQNALKVLLDDDSTTNPQAPYDHTSIDVLRAERNLYRTNRDYSIVTCVGFYILNIVDAAVDAHFYKFNIDKPLSMQKKKNWNIYSTRIGFTPAVGFCLRF